MKTLREEMTAIITQDSPERATLKILAMFEDRGLSLIDNGWLDDDMDVIAEIEQLVKDRVYARFGDMPVGTFYIDDGFKRKVSDIEARTVDFHDPEIFTDDGPSVVDPDLRVFLASGLN
ncbi:hypothetical protein ACSYAD_30720 [Acaryochloris marina NIES-2412]|uniref:hypothetical protein n=1 Tax=Acaryochloris marina TaxID=155978 RepID=UPI004059B6F0